MRTVTRGLIGLISVVFFLGGVTLLTPLGSEAEAKKAKPHRVDHNDRRSDHKHRVDHNDRRSDHKHLEYDNRKTHMWLEKIEGMLENGSTCPSADDAFTDGSGRYVTYPSTDPVEVCDMRTGVFYEQSPSPSTFAWENPAATFPAADHCTNDVGPGWRLPEVVELVSVVDYSASDPATALNNGPFDNVQSSHYWSASSLASNSAFAWDVGFNFGDVIANGKTLNLFVWCVRSGS